MTYPDVARHEPTVRFGLLGPLQVIDSAGTAWPVRAAKQRIVLAALLLGGGTIVSAQSMSDALWDACPPPNAPAVMRTYVMRLRRALGPIGSRVVRRAPGWRVTLREPEEFDLTEIERLRRTARVAGEARDWKAVSALLTEALSLWRGEPLADIPSAVLTRREADRLDELRLRLTEVRIDADLRLGRHAELVPELHRLAATYPLREHIRAQLMLACYRSGHQAGALAVYRNAHQTLAQELGVTPGAELWEMHERILAADAGLLAEPVGEVALSERLPARAAVAAAAGYRHGLPSDPPTFTGRDAELELIADGHSPSALPGQVVAIRVISGMPGVGKTSLAVHAAHRLTPAFPDRQMFIDLHGHTPGRDPDSPEAALAELLAAMGVDSRFLPADLPARSAMWRDKLAGQRAVLVLDNAASSDQVIPLLPGSGGCFVLVTSRRQLAELPGAIVPVMLDTLPPGHSRAIFAS